jgi:hypothetical protein
MSSFDVHIRSKIQVSAEWINRIGKGTMDLLWS